MLTWGMKPSWTISRGGEEWMGGWWKFFMCQLLSGCHILRWHVVTGPSGHPDVKKQNKQTPSRAGGRVKVRGGGGWDPPSSATKLRRLHTQQMSAGRRLVYQVGNDPGCFEGLVAFWESLVLESYFPPDLSWTNMWAWKGSDDCFPEASGCEALSARL